jgi:flagellar biosynthesis protein FlhF
MRIKTFYANTMAEALRSVKEEFGGDGLILSTKETASRPSSWFRGKSAVEVVAAIDNGDASDSDMFTPTHQGEFQNSNARAAETPNLLTKVDHEYSEMRRALYSLARPAVPTGALFSDVAAYELYQDLVANEVDEWLAYKLLDEAQLSLVPGERGQKAALARAMSEVARGLIRTDSPADGLPTRKIVAFVGPTGVGKTTAAAKLAAYLALEKKKKVVLLTTDTFRIGAVEQLRTYAGLMGIPFRVVGQIADLPQALQEHEQRDYILIDTAGRSQRDLEAVHDLMQFLQATSQVERHLVLSATTKPLDMREIVDRFGTCHPDCLLFTKLDETSTFGPIFNELVRTQKPLSYIADGQRVPEDLHAVRGDQIVNIVLNAH